MTFCALAARGEKQDLQKENIWKKNFKEDIVGYLAAKTNK